MVIMKDMMYIYMFHLADKANMDWVLEAGPWYMDKSYLVLCKCSVKLVLEQLSSTNLPIRARLWHAPLSFYCKEDINYTTSGID